MTLTTNHDWKIKKFQYHTGHAIIITGYTAECPTCHKRSRLFWNAGGYKFICRHCGEDCGGNCYLK